PFLAVLLLRQSGLLIGLLLKVAELGLGPGGVEDERDEPPADGGKENACRGDEELEGVESDQKGAEEFGPRRRLWLPGGSLPRRASAVGHGASPSSDRVCRRAKSGPDGDGGFIPRVSPSAIAMKKPRCGPGIDSPRVAGSHSVSAPRQRGNMSA